jgi:transketolase
LKPFPEASLLGLMRQYRNILVIEEHSVYGSLGLTLRALAHKHGSRVMINQVALQDRFIHVYGSHDELLAAHGWRI